MNYAKWQKRAKELNNHRVGYSDIRMWPTYIAYSVLFLTMWPLMGPFWTIVVGNVLTGFIGIKIIKIQNKNPKAVAAEWQRIHDIFAAIEQRDKLAEQQAKLPTKPEVLKQVRRRQKRIGIIPSTERILGMSYHTLQKH